MNQEYRAFSRSQEISSCPSCYWTFKVIIWMFCNVTELIFAWSFLPCCHSGSPPTWAAVFPSPQPLSPRPDEGAWADSITFFLKVISLKLREVKWFSPGHTDSKEWCNGQNQAPPGLLLALFPLLGLSEEHKAMPNWIENWSECRLSTGLRSRHLEPTFGANHCPG